MKTPAGADVRRAWPAKVSTLRMRKCSHTSESLILPPRPHPAKVSAAKRRGVPFFLISNLK